MGKMIMIVTLSLITNSMNAQTFSGKASYYADAFHGRKSASGKIFDMYKYTCAHKTLPFGTKLKVTNQKNGKSVMVEVTDRGPYIKGRILDLSKAAAMDLDMIKAGVVQVDIEIIKDEPVKQQTKLILSEPNMSNEFKAEVPTHDKTIERARAIR